MMRVSKNILASLWMLLLLPTEIIGQCTKPATSENAVMDVSDISKDTFDIGSPVRLVCHLGYEPTSGSPRKLVCGNNNQWSPGPESFTCQKKSCGHPGELANGHYEFPNRVEVGAVITAVCNTGHFAIGEKKRSCWGDGQWDGGNIFCEVVKCEPPKPIPNGQPRPPVNEMYEYGQAVQYVCNGDSTMLGANDTVHCLENGSWSDVPRCAKVVCDRPDIPNARLVEGESDPYGHKSTLRYECNVGYKMTPDGGNITCLENGWSSTLNCEAVECPNPGTTNAIITDGAGGPYEYSAILTYKCQAGHTLVGNPQLKCGSDGQWSSKPPTCQDVSSRKIIGFAVLAVLVLAVVVLAVFGCWCYKKKKSKEVHSDAEVVGLNSRPVSDTVNDLQSADRAVNT
ncbi:sushi, von Willebrand factor type A, EGF and pentraxin domain-containing protein 1-like isoform X2 [Clupea harengus]|uniref:Sushi, von Willebrand factor type A, EGF and pentraxin domain-containing protein 1-like isoform X2 n=1 Tax=Clupea harengus TaxID=7950 RepID=A0A6P8GX92_CLUHA|nr:sushi, von Willebrand factor type A, EGF and pentraxin domain-containing protein 1-like isoform X2 [Clupea harengus]